MADLDKVIKGLEWCALMEDALQLMADPDRVLVVRCRDCVEWEAPTKAEQSEGETFGHCRCRFGTCYGQKVDMNWFCADGARSNDNGS